MSQHRKSHGRTHAKTGGPRKRIMIASGVLLALGGVMTLTLQGGSDDTDRATSAKTQVQQSAGDRATEGDAGARGSRAEELKATRREAQKMDQATDAEERASRARAAKTAQTERKRAEQKREAGQKSEAAAEETREKTAAPEKQRQQQEETRAAQGNSGGGSSAGMSADERKLISLLNERRSSMGLPPVEASDDLANQAEQCSARSLAKNALEHCGHEVLFSGGSGNTPEVMIEAWFNSPGHKTALTYGSSTRAGAAIVTNGEGRLVAAINIDY
ncbi:CAP domain-containing protein [Streptomyces sp. NPDC085927]|uniref:CAP domain-containing protein n=1 Tax=Streptomyces sp. NPDC085927 TaxID=3365738 RepID=UPI0037D64C35